MAKIQSCKREIRYQWNLTKSMKMTKSFFCSNWLRVFFKASDLCQKQHFWKCKSSFTAHNEAPKTQKWKIVIFILKTVIFLELVKLHGASPSHFGLDLLFENRLRLPNGRIRRNNEICQKNMKMTESFFFSNWLRVFFQREWFVSKTTLLKMQKFIYCP